MGTEVDHLILEDPRIIGAILDLDIKELKDKIIEKGTTTGKDTIDGHEIEYKYRKGEFTQKTIPIKPFGIEHPESDAKSVLINMAKKRRHPLFSEEEAIHYVENILWPAYEKLEPGQELHAHPIGRRLVKRQATMEKTTFKRSETAAYRLVAKIIYEICWYVLEPSTLDQLTDDIYYYRDFAYGTEEYKEHRIMYRPQREVLKPDFYHMIQIHYYPRTVLIDIDFFQSVNFWVMLRSGQPIPLPKVEYKEIEGYGIFMDFSPDREKSKGYAVRYEGEDRWIQYLCPSL